MYTEELISVIPYKEIVGQLPTTIKDISIDSRSVQPKSIFICIKGYTVDGHDYAQKAVEMGAIVIVTERKLQLEGEVAQIIVQDTNRALGLLAAKFFEYPSNDITMIGVTGTNGKTSVSGIIHHMLIGMGEKSAVSGTIGFNLNGVLYESANTTSDALSTQQMIFRAKMEGCRAMVMEVSSHGLALGRLAGVDYDVAVFTNLTHDHLDFHGTMENYGNAKGLLFSQLGQDLTKNKSVILNADDPWSEKYAQLTPYPVWTYGLKNDANFRAENCCYDDNITTFDMITPEGKFPVSMKLIGEFNVYNILAATAVFYSRGFELEAIIEQIEDLNPVRGRMEKIVTDLPLQIFIDYAHTPDAIEKAINAALPYKKPDKKIIFLVGTGGNRDKSKRPAMAEKASKADYVVLTTDDPRYEEYDSITGDLEKGMQHENYACIGDRAEAVRHAVSVAEPGDIIIFAGKGHEDYQIIGNTKYPHSDAEIAIEAGRLKFV
ncbi:UDP-N-acetylmuramoyl-L-alanyl-D-glutamate--2,6-diaminopimelate ligase [Lysinibacillus endophyticus]|uniref:UDP-N-acetylmuramyl-tripeptide synthetase n=1 Tax=Ureibacillus endophyticus TaxID=1978490 RepID=A0A494Z566_9BACL|nr:UDP-N-acetylmuramoyl-L-alanyl-D-glutamate--2,6-diaminopimelate ligase [Lysinibacillus endophyticus]MCP1143843.1 UDP-N-acetylmuramoyl-L-alanyl-D-glutamate--2,6-diaminopimelate ligase [Lysinibacillus endophyticus]RKQ17669.1 UDP-N-acetylmuramoyl-L-alanyl-D-glutamate--2,6-diaminopimelate ligase [Lysinibacillus endophyticus]